ncbi:ATP-binding protein [Methylobacterium oryzae]|uniref:ATP-binding protein n=1 Tax=Methylobacterium oryzae TaxID=334852 RepID=UPI001F2CF596|nr:ATP-binding protein [Methylobacterium oryzae]UIN34877.1 ATP-binding protein [Methylobacterium oryzae]
MDILNVFTPALAIGDPSRFAGRQSQLDAVSIALLSQGTQIVIYGNRGVGKSSLAAQLASLAQGDTGVIDKLTLKPDVAPDFLVVSIECDDSVTDVRALILRLLTDDTALAPWIPYKVEKTTAGSEVGGGLNVKIFSLSGKLNNSDTLSRESVEQDLYATFGNAINHILSSGVVSGILFIIDEVDRIKNRDDLPSIIRARGADPRVKFALVGVGTTPQELIAGHESIVRQISDGCVEMPPMSNEELGVIFENAHVVLEKVGISFSSEARDWIIQIAKGHPYYVHLLGKHSLINAVSNGLKVITESMAREVLAEIANKGTAKVQEGSYLKAIGHSYVREFVLKSFADSDGDEINTSVVYPRIAMARGMDTGAISVYVGHLVSEKFGAVLQKTRERHYRFSDSLFKAYASARPFQYTADKIELEDSSAIRTEDKGE